MREHRDDIAPLGELHFEAYDNGLAGATVQAHPQQSTNVDVISQEARSARLPCTGRTSFSATARVAGAAGRWCSVRGGYTATTVNVEVRALKSRGWRVYSGRSWACAVAAIITSSRRGRGLCPAAMTRATRWPYWRAAVASKVVGRSWTR